ncbi:hypothetical protein [Staphylococcus phage PT94]
MYIIPAVSYNCYISPLIYPIDAPQSTTKP